MAFKCTSGWLPVVGVRATRTMATTKKKTTTTTTYDKMGEQAVCSRLRQQLTRRPRSRLQVSSEQLVAETKLPSTSLTLSLVVNATQQAHDSTMTTHTNSRCANTLSSYPQPGSSVNFARCKTALERASEQVPYPSAERD